MRTTYANQEIIYTGMDLYFSFQFSSVHVRIVG